MILVNDKLMQSKSFWGCCSLNPGYDAYLTKSMCITPIPSQPHNSSPELVRQPMRFALCGLEALATVLVQTLVDLLLRPGRESGFCPDFAVVEVDCTPKNK